MLRLFWTLCLLAPLAEAAQETTLSLDGVQVWLSEDSYRVVRDGGEPSRSRPVRPTLHLKRATFDPLAEAPFGAPDFSESVLPGAGKVYIVQFHTQALAAYRDALAELGVRVWQFLPYQAHLVWIAPEQVQAVAALPFVRWVGPYHPEYRMERELLTGLRDESLRAPHRYRIQVFEKGPAMKAVVASRIRAAGGTIEAQIPDGYILEATLTPAQLRAVCGWNEVLWIDRWAAPEIDMDLVRQDGGADYVEGLGGFTGAGVRGECMDGNCISTHPDLQAKPVIYHGGHSGDAFHGTPVTGICFGDGTNNPSARGLLPDGQPIFASYDHVSNRYNHTKQLLSPPYNAVFQSNSWGSGLTTSYNSTSMELDDILFDHDILLTQSQSNTGSKLSRPQAWSKNVVSVGAVLHFNNLDPADDVWGGTGSIGPAADGRVKPDLAFWYEGIFSPYKNGGYTQFGGTSAATPVTAGYFGLFFDMWHQGTFGNPTGATVFDSRPKATTARAFMINTAEQYAFSAATDDLSRGKQGWGRANVENLYDLRDKVFWVDETEVLTNLDSVTYDLVVPAGEPAFRATMVYMDLPGTTSAGLHRINDLTLQVTAPDGTSYWGNRGMKLGNWTKAGGMANDKDVVECVFVEDPEAGVWHVEIFADEINADSHVETGAIDADFALVVTGTTGLDADCTDPIAYCDGADNSVGGGGVFGTTGTTSLVAADLQLVTTDLPPGQFGLYFFGPRVNGTPLGDGTLCVGGSITRLPVITSDVSGQAIQAVDGAALSIQSGETHYFQLWYRDPGGPGGSGSNLSNGVQTLWCD
jgi:serine protease AprX